MRRTLVVGTALFAVAAGSVPAGADDSKLEKERIEVSEKGPARGKHKLCCGYPLYAAGAFELIHGVDGEALGLELARRAEVKGIVQPVLAQANLAGEASKHGAGEDALTGLVEALAGSRHLDLRGLMIIPPMSADPEGARPWFARLRELLDRLATRIGRPLPDLSMGMSDDFETAIEEGATLVRVGRAIFGDRA